MLNRWNSQILVMEVRQSELNGKILWIQNFLGKETKIIGFELTEKKEKEKKNLKDEAPGYNTSENEACIIQQFIHFRR